MPEANREYRDRLFKFIFGNPRNRAWTLSLYNAVNGTAYTDAESIRLTTIEDAVYMNMKNDVSLVRQSRGRISLEDLSSLHWFFLFRVGGSAFSKLN